MRRLPDWRARMRANIDELRRRPFDWRSFTCGDLLGRHVEALTGENPAEAYRDGYEDEASAVRLLADRGHADLGELASALLPELVDQDGRPAPSRAIIGDVAGIATDGPLGFALGIVLGARILVLTERGCGSVDLLRASRGWRVGDV